MQSREQRRKTKRYPVQWKAAVLFDRTTGKPTVHTETRDFSLGGTAITTEHGDLTGSVVTLLIAQPPRSADEPPKMLKIRARVVSTFQTPGQAGYRHGLSFLRSADDGLDALEALLEASAPPEAQAPAAAAAAPAPAPAAQAPGSRLAALKQAAQAKLTEPKKPDPQEERDRQVSEALERAYWYFRELVEQLNVVNPPYPEKGYAIAGVPEFSGFVWDAGNVSCLTRETSPTTKLFTRTKLDFLISGRKPMLKVTRDYPASEKFKQLLKDYLIEFSSNDARNERGAVLKTTFGFPCEVRASLQLDGNFETGKLLLKMRNVGTFGMGEYVVAAEAVTPEALEELTGFVLAESPRLGPLLLRNA